MFLKRRSYEKEILDDPEGSYTEEEFERCHTLLDRINTLLGGFWLTKRALFSLSKKPSSILEIGCGSGKLSFLMAKWFKEAKVLGIDLSEKAIHLAKRRFKKDNLTFLHRKDPSLLTLSETFSVSTMNLVAHHLEDEELVLLLQELSTITKEAIIINDLTRSRLGYVLFTLVAPILFRSRLIFHDGRLSIKRSFRKCEWEKLLDQAGIKKERRKVQTTPFFRTVVTIYP